MRTRALLAAVAASLVALAACGSSSIVGGTMVMRDEFGSSFYEHEWPDEGGVECGEPTSDLAFEGNGTITGGAQTETVISIAGVWFHVHTAVSVTSGSWVQPPPLSNISGTMTIVATYRRVSEPEECEPESDPCEVEFTNVAFVGSTDTASPLPTFAPGDTITISGANTPGAFETFVTGSSCGSLLGMDNGSIELTDVVIEV